jgi:hypothetical protein
MRNFDTGATRDTDEGKLDYEGFLSPAVLKRYAEYMHKCRVQADGKLRDADNWQKGIPQEAYKKSLHRHYMDQWLYFRGETIDDDIEEVLCAIMFNVQGLMFELLKEKKEENDDPYGYCEPPSEVKDKIYKAEGFVKPCDQPSRKPLD